MEKKSTGTVIDMVMNSDVKTVSAEKQLLADSDTANGSGLSARQRLTALFDEGTFMESGAYVRRDTSDETFEGVICGWGSVAGKLVFAFSQDYSRTKGALTEAHAKKIAEIYRLATENGAPVVGVFDSAGALLPEGVKALAGYGAVMNCASNASGVIPQIAVVPGVAAGASAVIAGMFDFVIVSEDKGNLSVNAPFVIGDAAGKSEFVSKSGLASLSAKDDAECMAKARKLLSYLPMNNAEGTVDTLANDDANRLVDLSEFKGTNDAAKLLSAVSDCGEFFELNAAYAPEMAVGFISLGGTVCGAVANRKCANGGVLTAAAARKAARMISFCDAFDIPVVTVVDSEGVDVSLEAEASPYAAELAKLAFAYANAKCALVTVVAGEAYGTVFSVMGSKALGADVVLALDTAKIGAMSSSRAVAFLMNDKVSEDVKRSDLEEKWNGTVNSAVNAANAGEIDDIVDDAELRQRIAGAVMMLSAKSKNTPVKRHANMPL